jgi:nicotinamide phosphoribosyltransferase
MFGFNINSIFDTDSYKMGHPEMTPEGLNFLESYGTARSDETWHYNMVANLQVWLKTLRPVTRDDVLLAHDVLMEHCGVFPLKKWMDVVDQCDGILPIEIDALPEGMVVPNRTPLYRIRNTRPGFAWVPQYVESPLLRTVWYGGSVATLSWSVKQDIRAFLEKTCDNPEAELAFRLHDFGARGVSSGDSAALGGLAHLYNFNGSDTLPALLLARAFYNEPMAAHNIPAMEHSVTCAWGEDGELAALENAIDKFLKPGVILSVLTDTYDQRHAVDVLIGQKLKDKIVNSGGTVVVRLDSGDPVSEVMYAVRSLAKSFGYTTNKKGYMVLPPCIRVIQGDGVNKDSIVRIMTGLEINGFSIENVTFGMGGGLLQSVTRDTLGYAQKAWAITGGFDKWIGIQKKPVTSSQKVSLKGRHMVVEEDGKIITAPVGTYAPERDLLQPVWREGKLLRDEPLSVIRARANSYRRTENGVIYRVGAEEEVAA